MVGADATAPAAGNPETLPSPARRSPPSPDEQARREAWGKMAGAKVAAAYREKQQEASA